MLRLILTSHCQGTMNPWSVSGFFDTMLMQRCLWNYCSWFQIVMYWFYAFLFLQRNSISPVEREKYRPRSSPEVEHKKVKKEEKDCHVSSFLFLPFRAFFFLNHLWLSFTRKISIYLETINREDSKITFYRCLYWFYHYYLLKFSRIYWLIHFSSSNVLTRGKIHLAIRGGNLLC